jgi:hypothetical protein
MKFKTYLEDELTHLEKRLQTIGSTVKDRDEYLQLSGQWTALMNIKYKLDQFVDVQL